MSLSERIEDAQGGPNNETEAIGLRGPGESRTAAPPLRRVRLIAEARPPQTDDSDRRTDGAEVLDFSRAIIVNRAELVRVGKMVAYVRRELEAFVTPADAAAAVVVFSALELNTAVRMMAHADDVLRGMTGGAADGAPHHRRDEEVD